MEVTIQLVTDTTTATVPGVSAAQTASNPNTDPQLLRKIATETDWELRRIVASNPNTPTDVLWQLGIDFPEAILSNPMFALLQLERLDLAAEIPHSTLTSLLQCERVPRNLMEYALSQQDYSLWLAVAYNPDTPSALLKNLAQKSRYQDRELIRAVAAHPHTPPDLLAEIVNVGSNVALRSEFNDSSDKHHKLNELIRFSGYYERLRFHEKESELKLRKYFQAFLRLDFKTCNVFLLNIFELYDYSKIHIDEFQEILCLLESYFIRRLFTGTSTMALSKIFDNLYGDINILSEDTGGDIIHKLRLTFKGYTGNKIFPVDEDFKAAVINQKIYKPGKIE